MAKPIPQRLALLNFGGIGDEILFSPVIRAVRQACPDTELTLILERRSQAVEALLPELDRVIGLDIQQKSRIALFGELHSLLRRERFDGILSSGSSPFIAMLLALSGARLTVGYNSGPVSQWLLSGAAPLNKQIYAGAMYYSLAETFLQLIQPGTPSAADAVIPQLTLSEASLDQDRTLLASVETHAPAKRILIHPGVSRISIEKNILKAWPVGHWQQLIESLVKQYPDAHIYLLGGPDDATVLQELEAWHQKLPADCQGQIISLYGKTKGMIDLAALIALGDLLISVDSAPLHLAVGLRRPVVAIFGPTDPHKLVPMAPWVQVACREELSCRPCLWDHRTTSCDQPLCLETPVDLVLAKVALLVNSPSAIR